MLMCVDIETLGLEPDTDYEAALQESYSPGNRVDPEKIEKHKEKWLLKKLEGFWSQPEGSRIVCIAAGFAISDERVFVDSFASDNEKAVLKWFCDFWTLHYPSGIMGYNISGFDWPIIESKLIKHNMALDPVLSGKWGCKVDLMHEIPSYFGKSRPLKNAAHSASNLYQILPVDDNETSGLDVAALWEEDKRNGTRVVRDYAESDVNLTVRIYQALSKVRRVGAPCYDHSADDLEGGI